MQQLPELDRIVTWVINLLRSETITPNTKYLSPHFILLYKLYTEYSEKYET